MPSIVQYPLNVEDCATPIHANFQYLSVPKPNKTCKAGAIFSLLIEIGIPDFNTSVDSVLKVSN